MINLSPSNILEKARELSKNKKSWHFHILTPECIFNKEDKYALILENSTDGESYVHYSKKAEMRTGEKLVKLLHGKDVVDKKDNKEKKNPSKTILKIVKRAKELIDKGQYWHHHMLFPDCIFNKHKGKWTIIFEDQENNEVLESVTDHEPKEDLKLIEPLFYKQKK